MKIYIFRHAQKATDFSGDPDLTPEGHAQASKLFDKVLKNELPRPTQLWVSPKKRTHSTFRPLSEHLKIPLETHDSLLEQKSDETVSEFRKRISRLLEAASEKNAEVIFICTHYDWVIEAMAVINADKDLSDGDFQHWTPCQHVGFQVNEDGLFEFLELKRIAL
jgi:broad specificity phosphatase PhoE